MKKINLTACTTAEAMAQIDGLDRLGPRDKNSLRLLTEEMFSMVKNLLQVEEMDFTLALEGKQYSLQVTTNTLVNDETRKEFLSLSTSGKNTARKGIGGMLDYILEIMSFECDPSVYGAGLVYGVHTDGGEYACMWSLTHYIETAPKETAKADWDGMEKSIIANFSDDVSIGVRSGKLEMTVTKTFA